MNNILSLMKNIYLSILIYLLFTGCTNSQTQKKWKIDVFSSSAKIEDFELVDKNQNIMLIAYNAQKNETHLLKLKLPEGNILWSKQFKLMFTHINTFLQGDYIKLAFYEEYSPNLILLLDRDGNEISKFVQKKVFFLNDKSYLVSYDPEIAFEEFESYFDTKFKIKSLKGNNILSEYDLNGEIIDAKKIDNCTMLIIQNGMNLCIYKIEKIDEKPVRLAVIKENIFRYNYSAKFIDDSTFILVDYTQGITAWNITDKQIIQIPLEQRFITSETVPDNTLNFLYYSGSSVYFSNDDRSKIIGISFNEQVKEPQILFSKFAGSNSKIELNHSAYFRVGDDKYSLEIPKNTSMIMINKIE